MLKRDIMDEELVDEKVAAGLVASAFFIVSVVAGTKLRAALFALLAPVALVYAIPYAWRFIVRRVKTARVETSPTYQLGCERAAAHQEIPSRTE